MLEIRPLTKILAADLARVTGPYTCTDTYRVAYSDSETQTGFTLELVPLETPFVGQYMHMDAAWIDAYLSQADVALGAFQDDMLVGVLIAETRAWNNSLWVHEFHVAAEVRQQGIGRALMEHAVAKARQAGLRTVVCETQNQNSSAIKAYRKLGFQLEGIDISYYTNSDYPDHGIAVFMKLRLDGGVA
jgi:streptothricin acetyltransferase